MSIATAGAAATIASDALMNPFDGTLSHPFDHIIYKAHLCNLFFSYLFFTVHIVVKQRMQVHDSQFRTVSEAARTVYRTEGLRAFYLSYPTTLVMNVPFTAVQFSTYEFFKKILNPTETYSPVTHVLAGAACWSSRRSSHNTIGCSQNTSTNEGDIKRGWD